MLDLVFIPRLLSLLQSSFIYHDPYNFLQTLPQADAPFCHSVRETFQLVDLKYTPKRSKGQ